MRKIILRIAIMTILLTGVLRPLQASTLADIGSLYAGIVLTSSTLAVFTLIPVCPNLKRLENLNCRPLFENDQCNLIKNLLFDANLSWQGFVAGLGASLISSMIRPVRQYVVPTVLGMGVLISHAAALALDIKIWKQWSQITQLAQASVLPSSESITNAIQGGVTTNGIFHLIPYVSLLMLGIFELVVRWNAVKSPEQNIL